MFFQETCIMYSSSTIVEGLRLNMKKVRFSYILIVIFVISFKLVSAVHAFFYKQHFYKQRHAEIGK